MLDAPAMNDAGDRLYLGWGRGGVGLRLYRRGDEGRFEARPDFAAAFEADGRRLPEGPKWTLTRGDIPIGVGGLEQIAEGRLAAWAYLSPLRPREWAFGAAAARAVLGWARRARAPLSITALPEATQAGAERLLARAGFVAAEGGGGPDITVMIWRG